MAVLDASGIDLERDVVIGRAGTRDLLGDLYRPAAGQTRETVIIHFHGGAFRTGNRSGARLARPLAAMGYTCLSASYRVLPEATWPAQIHDVKAAIRWARTNAGRLGYDAARLVVLGYSAGGRLALIAAGSQNAADLEGEVGSPGVGTDVAACVALYPGIRAEAHPVLGPEPSDALRSAFSPITYVRAGFPPTILLHGTADQTIPLEDCVRMFSALREVNAPVELHALEGMSHLFDRHEDMARACAVWIDLFLDRHVVNPRVYPSTEPPAR
jgi:acetyl esterase/lipase